MKYVFLIAVFFCVNLLNASPLGIDIGKTAISDTLDHLAWHEIENQKDALGWNVHMLKPCFYEKLPFKRLKYVHAIVDENGIIQKLQIAMEEGSFIKNYTSILKSLQKSYKLISKTNTILGDKTAFFESKGLKIDLESKISPAHNPLQEAGKVTVYLTYKSLKYSAAESELSSNNN